MKVPAPGLEIKQVLCGMHKYQLERLNGLSDKHNRSRSELVREAIDLWLRGYDLNESKEESI
jgi:metal-responsive CopG/Arc/MetJ family transcriptional regulator